MAEVIGFAVFSTVALGAAVSVVLNRQPVYSVLSLLALMLALAALFVMLGAYFVAALQVLLYAGAVLVLFLFVLMLLNLEPAALSRMRAFSQWAAGGLAVSGFLLLTIRILRQAHGGAMLPAPDRVPGTVEAIGRLLFREYLLPFELTSFLILAAILGAVALAKRPPEG